MTLPTPPAPGLPTVPGTVAVVAPYADRGAYAHEIGRLGGMCVAVTLPDLALPPAYASAAVADDYRDRIVHTPGLRHTVKRLRRYGVCAVVPGGPLGVQLAERLAHQLGLPGGDPATSLRRRDRGAQAAALAAYQVSAVDSLRTLRLSQAVQWARFRQKSVYVVAAADTSVRGARVCRTTAEIRSAWRERYRAAHEEAGEPAMVIQDYVPGSQYVVHSVSRPGPDGIPEHLVTEIYSGDGQLMGRGALAHRTISLYTLRVLTALGVQSGFVRCRAAWPPGRGPVLLAARAYPHASGGPGRPDLGADPFRPYRYAAHSALSALPVTCHGDSHVPAVRP
ncbi:hypothetical protein [Streptomyces sp. NPDC056672]|uniref:hypothetical protein n=1 Tax=Streptomyces sp. NPDC056672 TaxID=3345906 RepID=UPI0036AFE38B